MSRSQKLQTFLGGMIIVGAIVASALTGLPVWTMCFFGGFMVASGTF